MPRRKILHYRLLSRIQRQYRTLTESILLAGRIYSFTRIADPNRVLDDIAAAEDRLEKINGVRRHGDYLQLPYWAELWDSALGIGQWLIQRYGHGINLESAEVIDLGCGMGLTGMVAASCGLSVLFADLEPPALLFAQLNALPYSPPARTRLLNWQTASLPDRFTLIIGADILYERTQWDHLELFWRRHLQTGGSVLLGELGRQTGDNFPDWIVRHGWTLLRHEETVHTRSRPIRLFELKWDSPQALPAPMPRIKTSVT